VRIVYLSAGRLDRKPDPGAGIQSQASGTRAFERLGAGARGGDSGFDSTLYRNEDAKWHFSLRGPRRQVFVSGVEVNATSHELQIAALESKPL
jgi:hypothetical protein